MQITEEERILLATQNNYLLLLDALYSRAELTTDREELFIPTNDVREILKVITPDAYYGKLQELQEKARIRDEQRYKTEEKTENDESKTL